MMTDTNAIAERRDANPFLNAPGAPRPAAQAQGAMVAVEQQRVMAEVQAQMMMARANPRDPIVAMDRILNACTRPGLAEAAIYQYSRGGTDISGPSIRLAEAMAQSWGNIKTSVRELDQRDGASTVQAIAWDLETGYSADKVFQVPHLRYSKNGSKRLEDPRDVYEMVANNAARRLRACILAVIPGDVAEAAVNQCEVTMKATADTTPEAMQKMVGAFEKFGVSRAQIEARIQRRLDAIQPAQVVGLKKIYASLRDGVSTSADWFDPIESDQSSTPTSGTDKAKQAIKARAKPAPTQDANLIEPEGQTHVTYAQLADELAVVKTEQEADAVLARARHLSEDQQGDLRTLAGGLNYE